jgi:hypothetical protein
LQDDGLGQALHRQPILMIALPDRVRLVQRHRGRRGRRGGRPARPHQAGVDPGAVDRAPAGQGQTR